MTRRRHPHIRPDGRPRSRLGEFVILFERTHDRTPGIWLAFEADALAFARQIPKEQWPQRRGARLLWEQLRWNRADLKGAPDGTGVKLNDHLIGLYARAFMLIHPEYWGIFGIRPLRSAKKPPRGRESRDPDVTQAEFIFPDAEQAAADEALVEILTKGKNDGRAPDPG